MFVDDISLISVELQDSRVMELMDAIDESECSLERNLQGDIGKHCIAATHGVEFPSILIRTYTVSKVCV